MFHFLRSIEMAKYPANERVATLGTCALGCLVPSFAVGYAISDPKQVLHCRALRAQAITERIPVRCSKFWETASKSLLRIHMSDSHFSCLRGATPWAYTSPHGRSAPKPLRETRRWRSGSRRFQDSIIEPTHPPSASAPLRRWLSGEGNLHAQAQAARRVQVARAPTSVSCGLRLIPR